MMNNERYMKLLTKITNNGLDDNCTVEIMAWHNQTGQPVKNLCGLPEKIVLQRLIEEYLLKKEENAYLRTKLKKSNYKNVEDILSKAVDILLQNFKLIWDGSRTTCNARQLAEAFLNEGLLCCDPEARLSELKGEKK